MWGDQKKKKRHFLSPNKKPTGRRRKKEGEEEEEGDQAKVWMLDFGMNLCMEIMDFSMILV